MTVSVSRILFFLGLLSPLFLAAQPSEILTGLRGLDRPSPPAEQFQAAQNKNQALSLPFVDDFSYRQSWPDPNLWEDRAVYINATWARSPVTIGVASFDGLDEFGRPYALNGGDSAADRLSSRPIDLSNPIDSVVLSFYYQAGGWGEPPSNSDSLALYFWSERDSLWRSVWRITGRVAGSAPEAFQQVLVYVDSSFYSADFRFRFQNFGNRQGAFDLWHLDYVRLDQERSLRDSVLRDIAFTRPHPSLLRNYESIPWWHLNQSLDPAALAKPDLRLWYRRNVAPGQQPALFLGEFNIRYNGAVVDANGPPDADLDDSHGPNREERFPVPDTADAGRPRLSFLSPPYPDEFELISRMYYSGGGQISSVNDTLLKRQVFKNYYAYDDGSAERAYEVRNNRGGFVVQRYNLLTRDTLNGLQLYFLPSGTDISTQRFSIVVLQNDNGIPGSLLYESDSLYSPQFSDLNFYQYYALPEGEGVDLSSTVFIGIRQQRVEPLSLGYDLNRQNFTTAFYGTQSNLFQSFLPGTIMMRPHFGYRPRDLGLAPKKRPNQRLGLYPNPAYRELWLDLPFGESQYHHWQLEIRDQYGRLQWQSPLSEYINLPSLANGLYLVRLQNRQTGSSLQQKLIIDEPR